MPRCGSSPSEGRDGCFGGVPGCLDITTSIVAPSVEPKGQTILQQALARSHREPPAPVFLWFGWSIDMDWRLAWLLAWQRCTVATSGTAAKRAAAEGRTGTDRLRPWRPGS